MKIKVLDSLEEILPYKNIWNDILSGNDSNIVYSSFEWLYTWWQYHGEGNKPYILMLIEGDDIAGFCPLMKVPKRSYEEIRFIGAYEANYMEFIIRKEYKARCIERILDHLIGMKGRFLIDLHGLLEGTEDYTIVKQYLSNNGWCFFETSLERFYTSTDAQSFDDYLKNRISHKSIGTMKRKAKRLRRLGQVEFKPFDGRSQDLEIIFGIHDKRWQRKIGTSNFSEGETREFFKKLAMSKDLPFRVHIDTIDMDGRTLSFIYGFEYKNRYLFYRIGHDDNFGIFSPGEMVLIEKIRECFEKGMDEFDFGIGYEPYKAIWGTHSMNVVNFVFPVNSVFSRLIYYIRRSWQDVRQLIKKIPGLYYFVKYKLGKLKFFLYQENAKRVGKRAFHVLKDKLKDIMNLVYCRGDYYILHKNLKCLIDGGERVCRVEEASAARHLELLIDITHWKASDILRRFLKGDICILVYPYQDQGIHCLWFSPTNIEIDKIQYSWPLNRDSIYLYKHCYSGKEMKMDGHILRSVIECCKRKGYNKCYITATGRNQSLLSLLKKEGFDKFRYIRYTSWFGKPTYRVYQRNLE